MTPKNGIVILLLSSAVAMAGITASNAYSPDQSKSNTNAAVMQTAQNSARLAGAARFCNVDSDLIDEFISTTEARIAMLAKDTYEKIAGRLEFKNLLDATSVKEPEEGCKQVSKNFVTLVRNSQ